MKKNVIIDLSDSTNGIIDVGYSSIQPLQTIENWTTYDWANNIRWVTAQYNYNLINGNFLLNMPSENNPYASLNSQFVAQYIGYARYIYGFQYNTDYEWAVTDDTGHNTKIPMWRGLDINGLFNDFTGELRAMFEPLPKIITATGITSGVISERELQLDVIKRIVENKDFIKELQQISGVKIDMGDALDLTDAQSVEKYSRNFRTSMEIAYRNIAKDFLLTNRFLSKFIKMGQYCFISGLAMAEVYNVRGKERVDLIPPESAIFDMRNNDDQHYEDGYGGKMYYHNPYYLMSKWGLSKEQAETLDHIARTANAQTPYISGWNNLNWYQNTGVYPKIAEVSVQWRSVALVDGEYVECLREGTILGNKYMVGHKITPKSLTYKDNAQDKTRKRLRYIVCTPNTILNTNVSVVGIIHKIQDYKDMLITQMNALTARAMGKILYMNEELFPAGMRTPEMLAQIKQTGVITGAGVRTSANPDPSDKNRDKKPIEVLDIGISDGTIISILEQIRYFDNVLANSVRRVNVDTTYKTKEQISTSIQQSNNSGKWIFDNLLDCVKNITEYAADEYKMYAPEQDADCLNLIVGDSNATMLKMPIVKKMLDEDFKLVFDFDNSMDEQTLSTLEQMAIQSAPNNPDAALQFLSLRSCETVEEAKEYEEKVQRKREAREAAAAKQQQDAAKENTTINANAQQNIAQTQSDAALQGKEIQTHGKFIDTLLNKENQNKTE